MQQEQTLAGGATTTLLPRDTDGAPCGFVNHYSCTACGTSWTSQWSCMCNDRCPNCDREIEPHKSESPLQVISDQHGGHWGEDPRYPVSDWKYEVANDDTRSGYWEWVAARMSSDSSDKTSAHATRDAVGATPSEGSFS